MPTRYADNDPYTYPDSAVLRNKAGIRDAEALACFERLSVANRSMEDVPAGRFDYAHLKALHYHLFQDVYDWAGEERNVAISKGESRFAQPPFIGGEAERLLAALASENHLRGLERELFAQRVAHYMSELNVLHPFREGNGRALRLFLQVLAEQAGYDLDAEALATGWLAACVEGFHGNEAPMQVLLAGALRPFADADA